MKNIITFIILISTFLLNATNQNAFITNKQAFSFTKHSVTFNSISIAESKKSISLINQTNATIYQSHNFIYETSESTKASKKVDWKMGNIPEEIVRKHNTGIGLLIAGSLLTGIGTALMLGSSNKSNTRTSGANVSFTGAPAIGLLMDFIGIPFMIAGGVKIGKSHRLALYHLSNQTPKSINSNY